MFHNIYLFIYTKNYIALEEINFNPLIIDKYFAYRIITVLKEICMLCFSNIFFYKSFFLNSRSIGWEYSHITAYSKTLKQHKNTLI